MFCCFAQIYETKLVSYDSCITDKAIYEERSCNSFNLRALLAYELRL